MTLIDCMCQEKEEENIEESIDTSIKRLEEYIKKDGAKLTTLTRNNTGKMNINRTKITRKQKWEEKMY